MLAKLGLAVSPAAAPQLSDRMPDTQVTLTSQALGMPFQKEHTLPRDTEWGQRGWFIMQLAAARHIFTYLTTLDHKELEPTSL